MDKLYKWIWKKRLKENQYEVVRVKGWRTFLVDDKWGQRQGITFVNRFFK